MGFFDRLGNYFGITQSPNVAGGETPEEKQARMGGVGAANVANGYQARINAAQDVAPRAAAQASAPSQIYGAKVAAAPTVGAQPQVTAGQVASSYDPSQANQTRSQQQGYIDRLQGTINGTAPSAAVDAMRNASNRNVAGAYALAGSKGGYGGSSIREAQRQQGAAGQQLVGQVGQERAAETAAAQQLQGSALANMRGQDLSGAQTGAQLGLQAGMANQGANLNAAQGNQQVGLEAARANQAAQLQTNLTKAGFDQQAIMTMSDEELRTKLANAGFQVSQEQIDDLRAQNQATNRQNAINANTNAQSSVADRELQLKQLRAQYALAAQKNDQAGMDRLMGAMGKLQGMIPSGGGGSGGGSGGGGGDASMLGDATQMAAFA